MGLLRVFALTSLGFISLNASAQMRWEDSTSVDLGVFTRSGASLIDLGSQGANVQTLRVRVPVARFPRCSRATDGTCIQRARNEQDLIAAFEQTSLSYPDLDQQVILETIRRIEFDPGVKRKELITQLSQYLTTSSKQESMPRLARSLWLGALLVEAEPLIVAQTKKGWTFEVRKDLAPHATSIVARAPLGWVSASFVDMLIEATPKGLESVTAAHLALLSPTDCSVWGADYRKTIAWAQTHLAVASKKARTFDELNPPVWILVRDAAKQACGGVWVDEEQK